MDRPCRAHGRGCGSGASAREYKYLQGWGHHGRDPRVTTRLNEKRCATSFLIQLMKPDHYHAYESSISCIFANCLTPLLHMGGNAHDIWGTRQLCSTQVRLQAESVSLLTAFASSSLSASASTQVMGFPRANVLVLCAVSRVRSAFSIRRGTRVPQAKWRLPHASYLPFPLLAHSFVFLSTSVDSDPCSARG
jgi:hypothetical protein